MITGDVVQPMVDAVSGNRNVKQPLEDAVADVKIKNSWDTKRKNLQTARKRQINLRVKKCGDDDDGFFIDNISINNLVQCAMIVYTQVGDEKVRRDDVEYVHLKLCALGKVVMAQCRSAGSVRQRIAA